MKNNVVYLKFAGDTPIEELGDRPVIACKECRNKTFILEYRHGGEDFPTMVCSVCNSVISKMGWCDE